MPVCCADRDFGTGWRLIQEQGAPINGSFYFILESDISGDELYAIGGPVPQHGEDSATRRQLCGSGRAARTRCVSGRCSGGSMKKT